MTSDVYRFVCSAELSLQDAQLSLDLALIAVEGLVGEARVHLEIATFVDPPRQAIYIDATTAAGAILVRIFTQLLLVEFGPDTFAVRRMPVASAS